MRCTGGGAGGAGRCHDGRRRRRAELDDERAPARCASCCPTYMDPPTPCLVHIELRLGRREIAVVDVERQGRVDIVADARDALVPELRRRRRDPGAAGLCAGDNPERRSNLTCKRPSRPAFVQYRRADAEADIGIDRPAKIKPLIGASYQVRHEGVVDPVAVDADTSNDDIDTVDPVSEFLFEAPRSPFVAGAHPDRGPAAEVFLFTSSAKRIGKRTGRVKRLVVEPGPAALAADIERTTAGQCEELRLRTRRAAQRYGKRDTSA